MTFEEFKEMLMETGGFDNYYAIENFIECGGETYGGVEFIDSKESQYQDGEGENCWSVIRVDDVYYKVLYHYYSYNGTSFDDARVIVDVKPKQRMVTIYE